MLHSNLRRVLLHQQKSVSKSVESPQSQRGEECGSKVLLQLLPQIRGGAWTEERRGPFEWKFLLLLRCTLQCPWAIWTMPGPGEFPSNFFIAFSVVLPLVQS